MTSPSPLPPALLPVPGALGAGLAALVLAGTSLLPWYRVDLSHLGSALPTDAGFGRDLTQALGGMMQALQGSGVATSKGIDNTVGVVALVAALLCAALTFAENAGALRWDKGSQLLACALTASVGGGASVYALTKLGGPVDIHAGLALAVLASSVAVLLAFWRMQQFGRLRRAGVAS